ncbi:MAG: GatB/YqeY domain-containing protein [Acidobacteriaceae bacterium]
MSIVEKIGADIVAAMKAHQEHRLTTLRMVKSALRSKEIDKRQPLTDAEQTAVLSTLLKQRRESVESFTKGGRPELAAREQAEIDMIESYMPQAASEDELRSIVQQAVAQLAESTGQKPTPRDMGAVMKLAQQSIQAASLRADGKLVSELVKAELAK